MSIKPLKEVFAPHLNRNVKFGRKRPQAAHFYAPRVERYLKSTLPTPPTSTSYRTQAPDPALALVMKNDVLGCCVIAARGHRIGQLTSLVGKPFVYSDDQIVADYSRVGDYKPGDESTDQGCDMVTNNNDAVTHGYADGSKDVGWLAVDGTNKLLMQQVIDTFEGSTDLGIELPDEWITPFPAGNGFVWDVAGDPNPDNGHCVEVLDYDSIGIIIDSWGLVGTITWAAAAKYLSAKSFGETYLHLSPDTLAKAQAKAPNGVLWTDMIADFDTLGGTVTPPTPAPAPSPSPAPAPTPTPSPAPSPTPAPQPSPTAGVTLAQAQAWAVEGLVHGHTMMAKSQAEKYVTDALAKNWPKS